MSSHECTRRTFFYPHVQCCIENMHFICHETKQNENGHEKCKSKKPSTKLTRLPEHIESIRKFMLPFFFVNKFYVHNFWNDVLRKCTYKVHTLHVANGIYEISVCTFKLRLKISFSRTFCR